MIPAEALGVAVEEARRAEASGEDLFWAVRAGLRAAMSPEDAARALMGGSDEYLAVRRALVGDAPCCDGRPAG